MVHVSSRRSFIAAGGACVGALLSHRGYASPLLAQLSGQVSSAPNAVRMQVAMRTNEINGKAASMMAMQHGGKTGLSLIVNQPFNVFLENRLPEPTAIHWHGLHPPNDQDGVPNLTQSVVAPNANYQYNFPVQPSGTHWMHSHEGLQEAFLRLSSHRS
jgi:FtsP/CotA-like multicopper oxidase with cupredoxin domain